MNRRTRRLAILTIGLALPLSACAGPATTTPAAPSPAVVEAIGDTGLHRLTLTEKAVERLAIATSPVVGLGADRMEVPYSALLYQPDGVTFVYTNPESRTYVRHDVTVAAIEDQRVVLTSGPPVGTAVVTTGGAELWGTEFKIGKY